MDSKSKFASELDACGDYACIFKLVKSAVESTLGSRRAGLSLALADLPLHVGALHQLGSNFIIMNRILLDRVMDACDRRLSNAYVFHVLLHEYLHSLGIVDERETDDVVRGVTETVLGKQHPVSAIARQGIGSLLMRIGMPSGAYAWRTGFGTMDIVKDFETENLNYFG